MQTLHDRSARINHRSLWCKRFMIVLRGFITWSRRQTETESLQMTHRWKRELWRRLTSWGNTEVILKQRRYCRWVKNEVILKQRKSWGNTKVILKQRRYCRWVKTRWVKNEVILKQRKSWGNTEVILKQRRYCRWVKNENYRDGLTSWGNTKTTQSLQMTRYSWLFEVTLKQRKACRWQVLILISNADVPGEGILEQTILLANTHIGK